jgi:EKC/KEOPS complex subunit CGI121/TPRKB
MLEEVQLEHVPSTHKVLVTYYRNVSNAAFLQQQLLSRNADFEYAFIDATTLISRFHLLSAVYKAVTLELSGDLKTPNVHSEIVCCLSSNNNIAEAYRRYGISPETKDIAVVKVLIDREGDAVSRTFKDVEAHLQSNVEGDPVPVDDAMIVQTTDWSKLRKYHKLNNIGWLDAVKDEKKKNRELEMMVVSAMALRGL